MNKKKKEPILIIKSEGNEILINDELLTIDFNGIEKVRYSLSVGNLKMAIEYYFTETIDTKTCITSS